MAGPFGCVGTAFQIGSGTSSAWSSPRWRTTMTARAPSTIAPPTSWPTDMPSSSHHHAAIADTTGTPKRHQRGERDVDVLVGPAHDHVPTPSGHQHDEQDPQPLPAVDGAQVIRREQRVRREHHRRDQHDARHVLDRAHALLADSLHLEEVDRPEEEVAEREEVAPEADLGLAGRREQHDRDAGERDRRPSDVVTRDPLAEHPAGHQEHERGLHRTDELRVDHARALHCLEEEPDLSREEQSTEERAPQPGSAESTTGGIEEQHHRRSRDPHPPERDGDRRRVDRLHRHAAEAPAHDRERDPGDRQPRMVLDARCARRRGHRRRQGCVPSPRASGGRRSTLSTSTPSSRLASASPMMAKSW